jgi:CDP-paratose 2-epimerase
MSASLITGGSGFVGINLAHRLLADGGAVYILDNLSRANVARNLAWLSREHGDRAIIEIGDVRDSQALRRVIRKVDQVYHFAAQVAVTSSIEDPKTDFDVNVGGTLNLLEEVRSAPSPPAIIYTSTNKVYGSLDQIPVTLHSKRYRPLNPAEDALDETAPLDFHSPYGCSKGAAEQYVLDYQRTYGLKTVVFRMSCIYGPHQFGTEDQGWVAHVISRAIRGKPITIYGNGCQVRDLLYIDDLLNAFVLARRHLTRICGQAFNIGGGPENTLSLLELADLLAEFGVSLKIGFAPWRPGDQKYYVSDTTRFRLSTGWTPRIRIRDGIRALYDWLLEANGIPGSAAMKQAS